MHSRDGQSRLSVRIQSVITELVFEHALRVRMKAETSSDSSAATTALATPENASQASTEVSQSDEDGTEGAGERSVAENSSTAVPPSAASSIKGKGKASSENESPGKKEAAPPKEDDKRDSKYLVGKISNLVSSDLSNFENLGMFTAFIGARPPVP